MATNKKSSTVAKNTVKHDVKSNAGTDEKKAPTPKKTTTEKAAVIAELVKGGMTYEDADTLVNYPAKKLQTSMISEDEKHQHKTRISEDPRAGIESFRLELQERLQDVEEERNREFYELVVVLPKKLYKSLLRQALRTSEDNQDWTEADEVRKLIKVSEAFNLGLPDDGKSE